MVVESKVCNSVPEPPPWATPLGPAFCWRVTFQNVRRLTDRQADLLLNYLRQGGTLLAVGETAGALRREGEAAGLGQWVHLPEDLGGAYAGKRDAALRARVAAALRGLVVDDIRTTAPAEVGVLPYVKADGEQILHLINYDYDRTGGRFRLQAGADFQVRLDPRLLGQELGVYYLAPGRGGVQELAFKADGSDIAFRLPELEVYGVIAIGPRGRAPALWSIIKLRQAAADAPELPAAAAALARGDYAAAHSTADQALATRVGAQARAVLQQARAEAAWWERSGRTYRLAEAGQMLQAAADRYAAGDYAGSVAAADAARALLRPVIDGDLVDWAGVPDLPLTVTEPAAAERPHVAAIRAMNDSEWLYLAVQLTNTGEEPDLDVLFQVSGVGNPVGGKLYASRWGAGMVAGGTPVAVQSAVRDGHFELRLPMAWTGGGRSIELTVLASAGAPHLPASSRVRGETVQAEYAPLVGPAQR